MSAESDYRDDEIMKVGILGNAVEKARKTLYHDFKFRKEMGDDFFEFQRRIEELQVALDVYEEALHDWEGGGTPYWVVIARTTVVGETLGMSMFGMATVLVALAINEASAGLAVPQRVGEARTLVSSRAQQVRNLLPPDFARRFMVSDMVDYRLAAKIAMRDIEAKAVAAMNAVKVDVTGMDELLGELGLTGWTSTAVTNAVALAIKKRIDDREPPGGPPPDCQGLRDDFIAAFKPANNYTQNYNPEILKRAWPRFIRAALAYLRCLTGDAP